MSEKNECSWFTRFAPWVAVALTLVIQLLTIGYGFGSFGEKIANHDRRLTTLEVSDKEHVRFSEALAGLKSDTSYIREALRDLTGKKPAGGN